MCKTFLCPILIPNIYLCITHYVINISIVLRFLLTLTTGTASFFTSSQCINPYVAVSTYRIRQYWCWWDHELHSGKKGLSGVKNWWLLANQLTLLCGGSRCQNSYWLIDRREPNLSTGCMRVYNLTSSLELSYTRHDYSDILWHYVKLSRGRCGLSTANDVIQPLHTMQT